MNDEKYSLRAAERADEAEQRFDYFLAGVSAAIVGYLVPKLQPSTVGLNPQTLELLALLLFVASLLAGFRRIETALTRARATRLRHQSTEFAAEIQDALRGEGGVVSVKDDSVTPQRLELHKTEFIRRAEKQIQRIQQAEKSGKRWYRLRYMTMVAGFLALLGANLWKGYS